MVLLCLDHLDRLHTLAPSVDPAQISHLVSCCYALLSQESASLGLPDFPADNLETAVAILERFPSLPPYEVLYRLYPYKCFVGREGKQAVEDILNTFNITGDSKPAVALQKITLPQGQYSGQAQLSVNGRQSDVKVNNELVTHSGGHMVESLSLAIDWTADDGEIEVPCGSGGRMSPAPSFVHTPYQDQLLAEMLQSHLVHDICLIGPRGCGKSATVRTLSDILGYNIEPIVLYQDMSSRDLIQQRTTLSNGDTVWKYSPLVTAALEGKLAVLDGVHRIHPSTLAVVHRLVHDRELQLHDGQRLIRHDRYDDLKTQNNLSDEQLRQSGVLRIHPSFRMVALAEPPEQNSSGAPWLSTELLSLFVFHEMRPLALQEELQIVQQLFGKVNPTLSRIMELAHQLRESTDPTLRSLAGSLSTRQLLRVARRMARYPSDNPVDTIHRACLARFLPSVARQALDTAVSEAGLSAAPRNLGPEDLVCRVDGDLVRIGRTTAQRYHTTAESKVPDILFFDVPQHITTLEWLLQDFTLGEHLLLVGNQGVGKNKLADRLLQLLHRPREYIQLHRDTTVQTLTLQPTVKNGLVVYEDSPLVQAVKLGHVLVVDEADKAPTHVTCILKTLVESGEMILSDGRRIVPSDDPRVLARIPGIIPIHPDFKMIILANRPGFPFLGNDFFGALGDLFSCHAVDNPSPESELSLLKQYGPDVPVKVIERLVKAFGELRIKADQGLVQYPYSTREVVNIVRHLQEFRDESLASVVRNVFDFDRYSREVQETLIETLHKHGIPMGANPSNINLAKEYQHNLDRVEARATSFSEMQSYWSVPFHENSIIAGLTVSKSGTNNPLEDVIHVLTSNPLTLYSMMPSGDGVQELFVQIMFSRQRGARPQCTLAPLGNTTTLLLHEETSNTLLLLDTGLGQATSIPLQSTLELATESFTRTLGNTSLTTWHLLPQLLDFSSVAILYESGGKRVEVMDVKSFSALSMTLPFTIRYLHVAAVDKWLIQDSLGQKHLLSKRNPEDPCPNVLHSIADSSPSLGALTSCSLEPLESELLSQAIGQQMSSPHRILSSSQSYAALVVGFPDLGHSSNEIYLWPKEEHELSSKHKSVFLRDFAQPSGSTEATTLHRHVSTYNDTMTTCRPHSISPSTQWLYSTVELPVLLAATSDQGLATVDAGGCVRLWETGLENLEKSLMEWRKMIGSERDYLQLTVERPSGLDVNAPKHGKVDEKGDPHVGGNTWAGGTGGRDTAGLGGKGGPYRLDAGHKVHQVSQEEKDAVPEHVKRAAHDMAQRAFKQRLREIQMSEYDATLYSKFSDAVSRQVQALRVILGTLQAKAKERQWMKHQTSGELDDAKLIEGLTGERNIYRRRSDKEPELGAPQMKPKRLRLVIDVSGSMYRFNSYDGRLDREMEAVILVMEAFQGHEGRIQYDVIGHSGESSQITFISHDCPPSDNKQRLDTIKTMHAHAQFCLSGDNTLEATQEAITSLSKVECDEAIVVVLSDANLERYGIPPEQFARVLTSDPKVNAYAIFIGSLGDQASRLTSKLPSGRAFVCLDLKNIPQILQQIFAASVLNTRPPQKTGKKTVRSTGKTNESSDNWESLNEFELDDQLPTSFDRGNKSSIIYISSDEEDVNDIITKGWKKKKSALIFKSDDDDDDDVMEEEEEEVSLNIDGSEIEGVEPFKEEHGEAANRSGSEETYYSGPDDILADLEDITKEETSITETPASPVFSSQRSKKLSPPKDSNITPIKMEKDGNSHTNRLQISDHFNTSVDQNIFQREEESK
uniref:VWFA domain-containing protein n=1 Tax=Timema bartmani TaxID=61472 RepID=A0A7R9EPK7_9NEOP|nr:unnamed protein product [Timema bartmani]